MTCLAPGDVPATHTEAEEEEEGDSEALDLSKMVLLKPKGLDVEEKHLLVQCYRAEKLPKMDMGMYCVIARLAVISDLADGTQRLGKLILSFTLTLLETRGLKRK